MLNCLLYEIRNWSCVKVAQQTLNDYQQLRKHNRLIHKNKLQKHDPVPEDTADDVAVADETAREAPHGIDNVPSSLVVPGPYQFPCGGSLLQILQLHIVGNLISW